MRRGASIESAPPKRIDVAGSVKADQRRDTSRPSNRASQVTDSANKPREFFIHGLTSAGRPFRPGDWAERLCGVMSCYRPGGVVAGREAMIGYSPFVRPMLVGGVKCVIVDERLKDLELMALNFVMGFARDNDLPVYEGCTLPSEQP